MRVPGHRRGQRLSLIVIVQRVQTPPCGITAQQLYRPGLEHQTKKQKAKDPNPPGGRRRLVRWVEARWREKNSRKTDFKQQRVPLKRIKHLADAVDRKVQQIETDLLREADQTNKQEVSKDDACPCHRMQKRIARIEPRQSWKQTVRAGGVI